jgi:hypothetical protein
MVGHSSSNGIYHYKNDMGSVGDGDSRGNFQENSSAGTGILMGCGTS